MLMTAEQVATLLGFTENYLAVMRMQKRGPSFIKFGRAVRYRPEDVQAWLAARTVETA